MSVALISDYLDTYGGRDKFLRLLSYAAKLSTVCAPSKEAEMKFKFFGSRMSESRVILRFLDDIPSFYHMLTYGWGKQEPDWLIRWIEVIQNGLDVVFYPVEHIAWAGEHKLVSINLNPWDTASTVIWIISLNLSLTKSLRTLCKLSNYSNEMKGIDYNKKEMMKTKLRQRRSELLTSIRLILDISYAVSYLPPRILWGGRLKTWQVGALGTISSLIGLYQALIKYSKQKKCN